MGHSFHTSGTIHVILLVLVSLSAAALVGGIFWLITIAFDAWRSVRTAERAEYSLCDKHGAIRQRDMLTIAEGENGEIIDPVCPMCFTENLKHAKDKLLQQDRTGKV